MDKKKVMVGMSGGVDSSAAAALLIEQGYEVIGATMRLTPGSDDIRVEEQDAKKVCDTLGIEHFVLDFREEFKKYVIDYFVNEYIAGRTPNPCIACNKHIKFGLMYEKAKKMGMDYIATGHYAKIINNNGEYELHIGSAGNKDQSYVLYNMTQEILSHTLMPLGDYTKEEMRKKCADMGLDVASKSESMEICFVDDDDYARFICEWADYKPQQGKIKDTFGNVLGEHKGLINYTIGQRKGIGAYGRPMFVLRLDTDNNELILGEKGMEFTNRLVADNVNFLSDGLYNRSFTAYAKVRYQARPAKAHITSMDNHKLCVEFEEPQRAVTPGQAVVFYDGSKLLGGGIVC